MYLYVYILVLCLSLYCVSFSRCCVHSDNAESCVYIGMPAEPRFGSPCRCIIGETLTFDDLLLQCLYSSICVLWNSLQPEVAPRRFARSYSNSDSGSDSHEVRKVRSLSMPSHETMKHHNVWKSSANYLKAHFVWPACLLSRDRGRRRPNRLSKSCRSCCRPSSNSSARRPRQRQRQLRAPPQPRPPQRRPPPLLQQPPRLPQQLQLQLLQPPLQLKWLAFKVKFWHFWGLNGGLNEVHVYRKHFSRRKGLLRCFSLTGLTWLTWSPATKMCSHCWNVPQLNSKSTSSTPDFVLYLLYVS